MRLSDWCNYDYYDAVSGGCRNCKLRSACAKTDGLHCNYEVFSMLVKMETPEEIEDFITYELAWRKDKRNKRKGAVFHELACSGSGQYDRYSESTFTDSGIHEEDVL